jgi:hypothetical protein
MSGDDMHSTLLMYHSTLFSTIQQFTCVVNFWGISGEFGRVEVLNDVLRKCLSSVEITSTALNTANEVTSSSA